jgi:hypothetical protein
MSGFWRFCDELGAMFLRLPYALPDFCREFWHELRTGQEPAWIALTHGFFAAMFLLSVGLLASAAS